MAARAPQQKDNQFGAAFTAQVEQPAQPGGGGPHAHLNMLSGFSVWSETTSETPMSRTLLGSHPTCSVLSSLKLGVRSASGQSHQS